MLRCNNATDLRAEIMEPDALEVKKVYPVACDHPLVELWPNKIRSRVLDALKFIEWSEVGVYNFGFSRKTSVTSVVITVRAEEYDLREELKTNIGEICASAGVLGIPTEVIFDQTTMSLGYHSGIWGAEAGLQSYCQRPGMSHSIGARSPGAGAGTVGGYIALVDPKTNNRRSCILTTWHAIDLEIQVKHYQVSQTQRTWFSLTNLYSP